MMTTCTLCYEYLATCTTIVAENDTCFYVEIPHEVLNGWGMVLPKRHCETVFDLTENEMVDTHHLLTLAKKKLEASLQPDGFNVGWNCLPVGGQDTPHAHCHLIPRFRDEPLADKGIRYWFKQSSNRRP
jgi:diadenosine tetraphosphate (Ap4A) HIT family hydrolase